MNQFKCTLMVVWSFLPPTNRSCTSHENRYLLQNKLHFHCGCLVHACRNTGRPSPSGDAQLPLQRGGGGGISTFLPCLRPTAFVHGSHCCPAVQPRPPAAGTSPRLLCRACTSCALSPPLHSCLCPRQARGCWSGPAGPTACLDLRRVPCWTQRLLSWGTFHLRGSQQFLKRSSDGFW